MEYLYQQPLHLQGCWIKENLNVCAILCLLARHVPCVPGRAESVWTQDQALHLCAVSRLPQPQADLILCSMLYPRPPARPPAISCSPRLFQPLGKPVSLVCHAKMFALQNLLVTYLEAGLDGQSGEFFLAGCSCWQKEKNKISRSEDLMHSFFWCEVLQTRAADCPTDGETGAGKHI